MLNLSVDEIGEAHDRIRGAERNFEKLRSRAELIHDLKKTYEHVVLGVHTVISKLNVHRIPEIEREARAIFRPDSYITEVAENRVELKTMDKDITRPTADYRRAIGAPEERHPGKRSPHPVARLVESLRLEYYDLAARVLEEKRQVIDCYAGLGERAPRAGRERVGLLRARRVDGQRARPRLRLSAGVARRRGRRVPRAA